MINHDITLATEMTLLCVLLGVKDGLFSVDIKGNQIVAQLTLALKKTKDNTITCDADKLQLFLARSRDEKEWLKADSDDGRKLRSGETTAAIEALITREKCLDDIALSRRFLEERLHHHST
ncbi:hypothetical protein Poli38472_006473 [Pythium oligandrum]|uniref:Crinkler effector protein N-terminal domain-containing protein n=1 Tax=Pythium oligandrum TaxID=41045 RepID=A0A8K1C4W1_PYTOL|nr:hypothetical protein Poli38472_006473 [Pythium oligandrum]|eukprot:TMW56463.1 hypothetical protein Poli38472_006473 [Pythium oligandrum]